MPISICNMPVRPAVQRVGFRAGPVPGTFQQHRALFLLYPTTRIPRWACIGAHVLTSACTRRPGDCLTDLQSSIAPDRLSGRSPWLWPAVMVTLSALALLGARAASDWSELLYLIPYTFLGNSLAPLPYDGAVVFLGGRYAVWLIVLVAILATLVIEAWNMELLSRL